MPIKPSQALLAALALVAAPAFAQDSTTPAAPETAPAQTPAADAPASEAAAPAAEAPATPAPADTAAAPATDAAPAANAEPQAGQYYVKETHQDWTVRCLKGGQDQDPCELYQLLKDAEGNSVAEMTMIPLRNSEAAAGATLIAPLQTDLAQGVGLAVGSGEAQGYPFNFCAPVGCISRMGFTQPELDAMKRGSQATISLRPYGSNPDDMVRLTLSLSGFTAAYDALETYAASSPAANAPAQAPAADAPAN